VVVVHSERHASSPSPGVVTTPFGGLRTRRMT
jgi:hypothetical protein